MIYNTRNRRNDITKIQKEKKSFNAHFQYSQSKSIQCKSRSVLFALIVLKMGYPRYFIPMFYKTASLALYLVVLNLLIKIKAFLLIKLVLHIKKFMSG